MKAFTEKDISTWKSSIDNSDMYSIRHAMEVKDLVKKELDWQKMGLQETVTGYGRKLTSIYMIHFEGKLRRIYNTIISNSGSLWFSYKGKRIHINAH